MTKPSAARRAAAALRAYTSVLPSGPREGDAEAILTLAAVLLREDRENARLRRAVEAWREDKVAMKAIFNCRPGICTTCDLMRVAHSLAKPKAKPRLIDHPVNQRAITTCGPDTRSRSRSGAISSRNAGSYFSPSNRIAHASSPSMVSG